MRSGQPIRRLGKSSDAPRRLRDLIRSNIFNSSYPSGQLPSETELMISYGASRATVREALALLREDGLIDRLQGVGTFILSIILSMPAQLCLVEVHGVARWAEGADPRRVRPHIIDQEVIPTPEAVSARLGKDASPTCARIEYVAMFGNTAVGTAINYVVFPEADALLNASFRTDWYQYLDDAGLSVNDSELLIGALGADRAVASLLAIAVGSPLLFMEQIICDNSGRAYNFAVIHFRSDWLMFRSKASWQADYPDAVDAACQRAAARRLASTGLGAEESDSQA